MKFVSFDVETRGSGVSYALQPHRAAWGQAHITMCAFGTKSGVTGLIAPSKLHLAVWLRSCAAKGYTIVGWNVVFDMSWLIAMGLREEVMACKWIDAMHLYRHVSVTPLHPGKDNDKGFGLKAAVARFFPEHAGYDDGVDFEADDPEGIAKLFTYNKADAGHTLALAEKFWGGMTERQRRCALIEASCLPLVACANIDGIVADQQTAVTLAQKLQDKANVAMVTLKLRSQQPIDETVVASPTKLRKLLFEDWGLPPMKTTKAGAWSTDKDVLGLLAPQDDRAGLLHEFRESKNNRTKFAQGTLDALAYNGDGVVRPIARVYSTYTGRMTYSSKVGRGKDECPIGIALHQWKRDPEFRDIILPPEGYDLLEFDFAGQEFRWMAVQCKDRNMLALCQPGEDAHGFMGGKIGAVSYDEMRRLVPLGDTMAKRLRQLGKVANLSLQYRTSASTLQTVARVQHGINITMQEATAMHATYRMTYPRVERYWKDQIRIASNQGWVETVAGRRIHLGTGDTWTEQNKWVMTSTAINFPVQGTGADQKYLALAVMRQTMNQFDAKFYYELHDGIFMVAPKAKSMAALHYYKKVLSNLPYKKAWGVDLPVHFPVDAKIGPSWGKSKEIK